MPFDGPLRNVDIDPSRPLGDLHPEAIEVILDRGSLADWRIIAAEIERQPWGPVARAVEEITSWGEHYGADRLFAGVVASARQRIDRVARERYAARLRARRREAGLTLRQLATLAGTSESRLSAYETGRVAPTTTVLGRIELILAGNPATPPRYARSYR